MSDFTGRGCRGKEGGGEVLLTCTPKGLQSVAEGVEVTGNGSPSMEASAAFENVLLQPEAISAAVRASTRSAHPL